ncbi:MAG: hypothetical protein ABIY55_03165 [Kofleriaceae bacterium]
MRTAIVAVLCLVAPSLVSADPAPAAREVTGDCARARHAGKTCVLDLPAEVLTGDHATAGDLALHLLVFGTEASLIRVRHDFIPEIVKTADDL